MIKLTNIVKSLFNNYLHEQENYEAPKKLGFRGGEDFAKGIDQEFSKFYNKENNDVSRDSLFIQVANKANEKIGFEIDSLLDKMGDLALEFYEYTRMQGGGIIPYNLQNPANEDENLPEVLFKLVIDLNKEAEFTLNKLDEELPSYDHYLWEEQIDNLQNNLQNVVNFLTSNFEGSEIKKVGYLNELDDNEIRIWALHSDIASKLHNSGPDENSVALKYKELVDKLGGVEDKDDRRGALEFFYGEYFAPGGKYTECNLNEIIQEHKLRKLVRNVIKQ